MSEMKGHMKLEGWNVFLQSIVNWGTTSTQLWSENIVKIIEYTLDYGSFDLQSHWGLWYRKENLCMLSGRKFMKMTEESISWTAVLLAGCLMVEWHDCQLLGSALSLTK